ncbi:hypothetical protein B0J18DRAFT_37143 [Chaetomium sp. MPI-SDFR-AT-0129]|nr:hypothetical protein B0J18DRAFT_37143 [Chaetomium sp. MPI-SDFR-AT-0129]
MQKSRPLSSFKSIFPPIHAPMPLDQRGSQRLLETMKTSFRAELDKEHGSSKADPGPTSKPAMPGATDQHLRSILHNPLFSVSDMVQAPDSHLQKVEKQKAIFQMAVSRGLMDLPRAHGFLLRVRSCAGEGLPDSVYSSGAGRLVFEWLRSSGMENDLSFLSNGNGQFRRLLMRFMLGDGLDNVVWTWYDRLLEAREGAVPPQLIRLLMGDFVNSKFSTQELGPAYSTLIQAESTARERNANIRSVLRFAWRVLAFHTTVTPRGKLKPPADLFDRFVSMEPELMPRKVERAHVNLFHPVEPSSGLAEEMLLNNSFWNHRKYSHTNVAAAGVRDSPVLDTSTAADTVIEPLLLPGTLTGRFHHTIYPYLNRPANTSVYRLVVLGIDTVQHLIRTNREPQAMRVWDRIVTELRLPFTYEQVAGMTQVAR